MPVVPVSGEHVVGLQVQGGDRPDGNGLLADVEVAETPDLPQPVHLCRLLFQAADQEHLPQKLELEVRFRILALCHGSLPTSPGRPL